MSTDPYVWTEALGCGEILPPMLASYLHHHENPINVFVYPEDLEFLPKDNRIIANIISDSSESLLSRANLEVAFSKGHAGTALLWARIIRAKRDYKLVHLDADTVFIGNVLDMLLEHQYDHSVVGSRRPYRHSIARKGFRKAQLALRPDAVNTHCFLFDPSSLQGDEEMLASEIMASRRHLHDKILRPVIDFFDPVTFRLRKDSGIYYMDSQNQRKHGTYSREGEFESKMISFSAVGSGSAIYKGKSKVNSQSYKEFALQSYALYCRFLLDKAIDSPVLNSHYLIEKLNRLDRSTWSLTK